MNDLNYLRPKDRSEARLLLTTLLATVIMAVLLIAARRTAPFSEAIELPLYDQVTELTWPWVVGHDDIVLVTQQRGDPFENPLPDADLAALLKLIVSGQPAVVAIDISREDKDNAHTDPAVLESLENLVLQNYIVWGYKLVDPNDPHSTLPSYVRAPVGPPAGFDPRASSGFASVPPDGSSTGTIRRAQVKRLEGRVLSLAAATALNYIYSTESRPEVLENLWGRTEGWCDQHFWLAPDTGGYALPGGERDEFLLKYGPDLDSYFRDRNYSLSDLRGMSPEERRATFQGKIVFFGTERGGGGQDEKRGIGNPELRGVKLQALTTGQMLREIPGLEHLAGTTPPGKLPPREAPIRTLPNLVEDFLIVLAGLLAALIFLRWPSLGSWKSVAVVALLLGLDLGLALFCLRSGYWVPMGAPMLITAGAGFTSVAMLFAHMRSEAVKAYLLLARNVGPALARVIWINRTRILGNKKVSTETFTGTIFFSDLAGYTPALKQIEQEHGAEAAAEWIGAYMQHMISLVTEHHGFVKDFEGDAIMAVFGFPADGTDRHAARAVRCARAMDRQFRTLNAALPAGSPRYRTRIGIYTGEIKPEHLSTELMFEFSFTGFAVNKAKRLETFEKKEVDWEKRHSRILIGADTRELMDPSTTANQVPGPSTIDPNIPPEFIWEVENNT